MVLFESGFPSEFIFIVAFKQVSFLFDSFFIRLANTGDIFHAVVIQCLEVFHLFFKTCNHFLVALHILFCVLDDFGNLLDVFVDVRYTGGCCLVERMAHTFGGCLALAHVLVEATHHVVGIGESRAYLCQCGFEQCQFLPLVSGSVAVTLLLVDQTYQCLALPLQGFGSFLRLCVGGHESLGAYAVGILHGVGHGHPLPAQFCRLLLQFFEAEGDLADGAFAAFPLFLVDGGVELAVRLTEAGQCLLHLVDAAGAQAVGLAGGFLLGCDVALHGGGVGVDFLGEVAVCMGVFQLLVGESAQFVFHFLDGLALVFLGFGLCVAGVCLFLFGPG